jgi:hypothetical protein
MSEYSNEWLVHIVLYIRYIYILTTFSNKPRGLKHKIDYDKEEETDMADEDEQQTM